MEARSKIKYFIMDVDGTLTDGKIYLDNFQNEFKAFHVKDGYGIRNMLPAMGITPMIITARNSNVVEQRCKELNIKHVYQGCYNKKNQLFKIAEELGIRPDKSGIYQEICYIGDDMNDIEIMKCCGIKMCPFDAVSEIKIICDYISDYSGGNGAVRDAIIWLNNPLQ